MGNAGEGGSSSSGRQLNEGFPLVWVVLKDPFSGRRPVLCLGLDCNYVGQSRDKKRVTYSFLTINPVFVK